MNDSPKPLIPLSERPGSRIPSALKWLRNRQARLLGEIQQLKQDIERAVDHLDLLRQDLNHIETVLFTPAVSVDVADVMPVRPMRVQRALPHGQMTRAILECLRIAGEPVSTPHIAWYVIKRTGLLLSDDEANLFKKAVERRLRNLLIDARVIRFDPPKAGGIRRWTLRAK